MELSTVGAEVRSILNLAYTLQAQLKSMQSLGYQVSPNMMQLLKQLEKLSRTVGLMAPSISTIPMDNAEKDTVGEENTQPNGIVPGLLNIGTPKATPLNALTLTKESGFQITVPQPVVSVEVQPLPNGGIFLTIKPKIERALSD